MESDEVLAANQAFYRAFKKKDIEAMSAVWSQGTGSVCIHPGRNALKQKSHYVSLRDQLKFMVKPELRREPEVYINQQGAIAGFKALIPSNLQQASDSAVANLYWYFKVKEQSAYNSF